MQILCPAKVNLFLSVGPKDTRGYHPIRTIFQAIGLCDVLTIEEAAETSITCNWPELPTENTLTKTLRLLTEVTTLPPIHLHLEKRIPAQSGLGGGSSDAAGILKAAKLLDPAIPDAQLHDIAKAVGADVPFFLIGGRARGEGYGEILTPIPNFAQEWLVVAQPDAHCSTAEAYARLDEIDHAWLPFPDDPAKLHNDFQLVAPKESLQLIEQLKGEGAKDAALTGSGSAAFGAFPSEEDAKLAASRLQQSQYSNCWAVRMLDKLIRT